jgi:tetratricopeptide (TPR) repeat protein
MSPYPRRFAPRGFFRPPAVGVLAALLLSGLAPTASSQPQVALEAQLIEVNTAFQQGQPDVAAGLLERIVARLDAGEVLPGGVSAAQIRLAAATAAFQSRAYPRAAELAATVRGAPGATAAMVAEAALIRGLSLALSEKFEEAIPVFQEAEASPTFRDRAILYGARAAYQAGKLELAIEGYNRVLAGGSRDADWADAALTLIALHLESGNLANAKRGLALLRGRIELVDNLAGLNILYLQLGDALFAAKDFDGALAAYRTLQPREVVVAHQNARNEALSAQLERLRTNLRPAAAEQDLMLRVSQRLEQARSALASLQGMPGYDALVRFRLALCFQERGGTWQAALLHEDLLANHAEFPERERAWFQLVRAYADANRFERVRGAAERFQAAHPASELLPQAMFVAALAAGRTQDPAAQLRFLDEAIKAAANPDIRQTMFLMRSNALFNLARYEEARDNCDHYAREFPSGRFAEEHLYLAAMAELNIGRSSLAEDRLKAYLAAFPKGQFVADARYRLAATAYSRENYKASALLSTEWLHDFPFDHPQRGEVLSLQGDAFAALREHELAITAYTSALQIKLPDELLGYVLDELTRLHQSRREYDQAVTIWTDFARENPDHPFVINAAYWIGRLRAREGRVEEAIEAQAAILRRYVTEPQFDNVERLLIEFASLLARPPARKRGEPKPEPVPIAEAFERAETLLVSNRTGKSPTTAARVLFTQAEIATARGDSTLASELLGRIAATAAPDTLPPGILGKVGDQLLAADQPELAAKFYARIVDAHARSVFADFGYHGLGQVALRDGRPTEALAYFNAALDKAGARYKLREVTLGRGYALLALDRLDEARQVFENVASNRAWRGDATAASLVALGDIAVRRGTTEDLAKAQAHYQRVYIGYRRFVSWVAAAYVRSAETFVALGQRDEAITTLQRMVSDDRLQSLPDYVAGQNRLRELIADRDSGRPSTARLNS